MMAIDADGDGEISAKEIENAAAALKALDKDKDGKLSGEELRPAFGGPGGGRGQGGPGGGENVEAIVAQMMTMDKNGDSKLSKDELPERMQALMGRADTNKDGFLDKAELTELATQQMRRNPGGPGGNGNGRPPVRKDRSRPTDAE